MSDIDDLRARVDRVETELAELRTRAETAETLARFADRDASDIKASHAAIVHSLSALRKTQAEHGRFLAEHSEVLAEHGEVLAEHSEAHAKTLAGIQLIVRRLDLLTKDD